MTRWRMTPALSTRRKLSSTPSSYWSSPKSRQTMIAALMSAAGAGRSGKCFLWLLRLFFGAEVDRTRGHDGRDGVLVHHLGHRVAQQHHVLVERLDLALELDAVDEIDRDRDMLFA